MSDREIELKFATTPEAAARLAGRELGGALGRELESVYFDTQDRQLRAAGFSLRVRRDGDQWLQTLKSGRPGALRRGEWERPLGDRHLDTNLLADTPLAERLNGVPRDLAPVFITRLKRRSRRIQQDRSDVELSLDEGEIVAGDARLPVLELELELKSGPAEALYVLARRLSGGEALTLAFSSKAERGYALADGVLERAARFKRPKLRANETAEDAFQAIAPACLRQLTINADLLSRSPGMEAIHQARVGLRRLRVALSLFQPLVADDQLESVKTELRWLAAELADARSLDAFITGAFRPFADEVEDPEGAAAFGSAVLHAQTAAYARARAAVGSPRFRLMILNTAQWVECGAWTQAPFKSSDCEVAIEHFARDALDWRRKVIRRRGDHLDWSDPVARHRLRIQAKKLRYGSDFFEVVAARGGAGRYARFSESLEELQGRLGELNDIAMCRPTAAMALAADEEVDVAGVRRRALSAGLIVGARQSETPKLVRQAKKAYHRLVDAPVWWRP